MLANQVFIKKWRVFKVDFSILDSEFLLCWKDSTIHSKFLQYKNILEKLQKTGSFG